MHRLFKGPVVQIRPRLTFQAAVLVGVGRSYLHSAGGSRHPEVVEDPPDGRRSSPGSRMMAGRHTDSRLVQDCTVVEEVRTRQGYSDGGTYGWEPSNRCRNEGGDPSSYGGGS